MSDISALLDDPSPVPSLDALARPLAAGESRKLWGDDDARLNEAVAAMTRLVESRPGAAAALAEALEHYRAYAVLSASSTTRMAPWRSSSRRSGTAGRRSPTLESR